MRGLDYSQKNMPLWGDHVTSFALEHSLQHSHNSFYFVMKPHNLSHFQIMKEQPNGTSKNAPLRSVKKATRKEHKI
jgi:hypothetical protein